ncbi:lipase family protein [Prescottella agglutinans]|uniref:Lipase n=1 Tax=Prescottella agglutinans TaxID=1644129 RepID=A0ABT6MBU0_9NOCA|nr:lipase family protein [Prescottella agglutinans]MDH6281778.1 hypothetical protein [Prescottella agglutinans]
MTGNRIGRRFVTAIAVALLAGAPQILTPTAQAVPVVTPTRDDPGAVLESAPLPQSFWLPGTGAAYRITYETTGPNGRTPCTGMVFVPAGSPPQGGWPVIAWAHGTIGDSDADAPSRNGVDDASSSYVANWLARGYAVAATDYIGLGTPGVPPYLNGKAAAHSVIDSVRAARAVDNRLSPKWAVVGLSEGGQASVFTAHAATEYAPELDYRGAVATGVPSNIETIAPLAGPNFPPPSLAGLTNFMTFVIAGLRDTHPELDVNSYLTPIGRTLVDAAPEMPYPQFAQLAANVSVAQMLSRSLNDPAILAALRDYLQVPTHGYDRPLMIQQGVRGPDRADAVDTQARRGHEPGRYLPGVQGLSRRPHRQHVRRRGRRRRLRRQGIHVRARIGRTCMWALLRRVTRLARAGRVAPAARVARSTRVELSAAQ